MADNSTTKENIQTAAENKGKGKAAEPVEDTGMDVDDSSEDDEVDENEPVADEEDEDNMEEINTDNIIPSGRRTRGRNIDFAKAAAEMPADEDEDEDEDDDFQAPEDEDEEMKH
ncbi:uncharacterized protein PAC_03736 [Phialocephala subalpina]|uniref:Histone chaperone domain-containing protein n=1 Tax=Phialocephala subalpina TaxID=576137 RepID=A0A1L7WM51_9HELO|nr:uncharacterized protein PAC_03736 [Phialocephala subalpina]